MSELIIISETEQEKLIKKVSDLYREVLISLSKSDLVTSGWPGGRSLLNFFPAFSEALSELPNAIRAQQHFFQVDERVSQDFNREVLEKNFFANLVEKNIIKNNQVHYYPTDLEPEAGIAEYTNLFNSLGSKFNYIMLGAGNPHQKDENGQIAQYDCHVAGIFPHHPSSKANNSGFYYYFDSPKPPPGRITATYNLLSKSDWCFLFIMGPEKKEVVREFLDKNATIENAPVKIASRIKNCVLITDQKV
jgi:6-phosphogluconolactonase/glucosamine-6-phosphate isomerase/deaminase